MNNEMTVSDLWHIWVEENPSTSESSRAKDRIALKIADEYFSNYDVLEMTFVSSSFARYLSIIPDLEMSYF